MLLVALLLWPMMRDCRFSRIEGISLLVVFLGLILLTLDIARREGRGAQAAIDIPEPESQPHPETLGKSVFLALAGLAGLAAGAKMTVVGAVFIGEAIGLSKAVISLTVIAFGTSLPELVTCIVATLKGEHDISVGNLVGSNIFNTLLVTGAAGTVRPFYVSERFGAGADYWIMIVVSVVFAVFGIAGRRVIGKIAGLLLVAIYAGYLVYLFGFSRS